MRIFSSLFDKNNTELVPGGGGSPSSVLEILTNAIIPAAVADRIKLFAKPRAGRVLLNFIGPSGVDSPLQPALFGNNIMMWLAGASTTVSIAFGTTWTARNASGAQSHPTKAATNFLTQMTRALFSTTTAANTASGIVSTASIGVRGNAAKIGGFHAMFRFGVETWSGTGQQMVVGLTASNAALAGEPSALANMVALTKDSADTNWQLCFRDGSTLNKINTGEPVTAGRVYDLNIFCKPNDTKITVRLVRLNDDAVLINDMVYTTNLPVNTTFLFANVQIRNTGAAINGLALNRIYVETDI